MVYSPIYTRLFLPRIVSINSLTHADGVGSVSLSLREGAGRARGDQAHFLCLTQTRRTHRSARACHLQVQ